MAADFRRSGGIWAGGEGGDFTTMARNVFGLLGRRACRRHPPSAAFFPTVGGTFLGWGGGRRGDRKQKGGAVKNRTAVGITFVMKGEDYCAWAST